MADSLCTASSCGSTLVLIYGLCLLQPEGRSPPGRGSAPRGPSVCGRLRGPCPLWECSPLWLANQSHPLCSGARSMCQTQSCNVRWSPLKERKSKKIKDWPGTLTVFCYQFGENAAVEGVGDGKELTADVVVLVRVVPTVVDEVTQVVFGDAVTIHARVLFRCARLAGRKRWRAVQEADIVYHQVTHVADSSLGSEHHLREGGISTMDNRMWSDRDVRERMFFAKE